MSDERQAFEQLHAIPSGAIWCEKRHITYTKTILVWFYTPSMNHGKRSAKGRFGKPAAKL